MTQNNAVLAILVILAVLISLGAGYFLAPTKVQIERINTAVPGPQKIIYQNVTNEVVVDTVLVDHLDKSVQAFFDEFNDDENFPSGFDEDQLSKYKVYEDYSISLEDEKETVSFKIKLKYVDSDVEEKEYLTCNPVVTFEEGEDPVVELNC